MPQVSFSASLNYTAPGGAQINQPLVAIGSYGASSLGTLDIPSGSSSGATFSIPLGGVNAPCAYVMKSSVGTGIVVRSQGNPTGAPLLDGGVVVHANPKTPALSQGPLSSLVIQLTAAQSAYGSLDYMIFGD